MPLVLMARCYYSKKAVDGYLKNAWDMQDIAQHYLESPGKQNHLLFLLHLG